MKKKILVLLFSMLLMLVGCSSQSNVLSEHLSDVLLNDNALYMYIAPGYDSIKQEDGQWIYDDTVYFFFESKDDANTFKEKYNIDTDMTFYTTYGDVEVWCIYTDLRIDFAEDATIESGLYSLYNDETKKHEDVKDFNELKQVCDSLDDLWFADVEVNEKQEITKLTASKISFY